MDECKPLADGAPRESLQEFTYDFFLFRFGLRAAAEHHLQALVGD